jgi:hypothetical protein
MKKSRYTYLLAFFLIAAIAGCNDMLNQKPPSRTTDKGFWKTESNIKSFAWGFYPHFFKGYSTSYAGGKFFTYNTYSKITDDYGYPNPPEFPRHAPVSGLGISAAEAAGRNIDSWGNGYAWIYKANVFINRLKNSPIDETAKKKWLGIARFFRALEYNRMVRYYGAVPYYGQVVHETETKKLYEPRTPRTQVVDSMLADFQYAVENVPPSTGTDGLTVNKNVVLAFESRVMLFQGSYLYYHKMDKNQEAIKFLKAAQNAALQVIKSGNYSVTSDYRSLFNSLDLAGNPGIILYRHYQTGSVTNAVMSFSTYETQHGINKDGYDTYLCDDGLPISLSPEYQGDKSMKALFANRDPRMKETLVDSLRLDGAPKTTNSNYSYSSTGISVLKYVNESILGTVTGTYNNNPIDAPVMRYGEVLLNYVEATAILAQMGQGTLTQHDLDISINKLRDRPGINMPHLQIMGNMPAVNGKTYDDPDRDPTVPPMMWEIRRARRVELMMEGFRQWDLKRWNKLNYADYFKNPKINEGAWINFKDWPATVDSAYTLTGSSKGYILADPNKVSWRKVLPRDYLGPIPLDQIQLYEKHGITLKQNPGW